MLMIKLQEKYKNKIKAKENIDLLMLIKFNKLYFLKGICNQKQKFNNKINNKFKSKWQKKKKIINQSFKKLIDQKVQNK